MFIWFVCSTSAHTIWNKWLELANLFVTDSLHLTWFVNVNKLKKNTIFISFFNPYSNYAMLFLLVYKRGVYNSLLAVDEGSMESLHNNSCTHSNITKLDAEETICLTFYLIEHVQHSRRSHETNYWLTVAWLCVL